MDDKARRVKVPSPLDRMANDLNGIRVHLMECNEELYDLKRFFFKREDNRREFARAVHTVARCAFGGLFFICALEVTHKIIKGKRMF